MAEMPGDFSVHRFVQDLFEDLSLTLPSLGCRFEGVVTPSTLTAVGRRSWIKNKVFLLFADLAVATLATGSPQFRCRFTLAKAGSQQRWCFFCTPFLADPAHLPAWDAEVFEVLRTPEGEGFAVLLEPGKPLELGPPVNWTELARLYGSSVNGQKMLEVFVERAQKLVPELEVHLAQHEGSEILRVAHTLKGSARGIAAQSLSHAAHQLEMMGRSGDLSQGEELYKALLETYHEFTSWVQAGHP